MTIVEIMIMSADPEIYCLVVHGEKVGEGSYAEMYKLGADYDSAYEPEKGWQDLAAEDPEEHWARRLRQSRACQAVLRQTETRRRQERIRSELRPAYFAAAPSPQPIRPVKTEFKLIKSSPSPQAALNSERP